MMGRCFITILLLLSPILSLSEIRLDMTELPEVLVLSKNHKVLHMLAYVREYSTLTTYTDTVFLFREKMVDYMLPAAGSKFKGWTKPRVLTSKSYYQFKDSRGLDSVSDVSNHHFSWSDWIGIVSAVPIPERLRTVETGSDTVKGKYSLTEIWVKNKDSVKVSVNVMADTASRRWVRDLSVFFKKELDFESFGINFSYDNVLGDFVSPLDLTAYSFKIKSQGRGYDMFRFNRKTEPFFVSTCADVWILDREFITEKEARKWERQKFDSDEIGIYESTDAPTLSNDILSLIDRVENIDKNEVKLDYVTDQNMKSEKIGGRNFKIGRRALLLLKQATGITRYRARKNLNRQWDEFRKGRREAQK